MPDVAGAPIVRCVLVLAAFWAHALGAESRPPAVPVDAWREQIERALWISGPAPELAPEFHGQFAPEEGLVAERVTYGTQFGLRIPAIVYRPAARSGRAPALIVVNGHGGDKYSWYAFYTGILYARAGGVVLTYDPAGEGERHQARRSGTRAHDKVESPPEIGERLGGLMVTDLRQAVAYLAQRADVDPGRIGAVGYSMGSFVLALVGAIEPRLKACVLAGGGNLDGTDGYWDQSKPMCQGYPYRALSFLPDRPAALYALHAARGPTLVYNGTADDTVRITEMGAPFFEQLRARVVALRGSTAGVFEAQFLPGMAHRPYFVTRPVARWLQRQLSFPRWTDERLQAMGETRIGAWARERGVELDKLYATEPREAGTLTLDVDVPALTRSQLSVFSAAEWERRKDLLIHESWLKTARARTAARTAPLSP